MIEQLSMSFNYADLDAETRIVVQQRTTEIKALMKRAASDIIEIGQKLIEVKAKLGHGNWEGWLKLEFTWSDDTAKRFMSVSRAFESRNLRDLDIAPSALYLLAAPSTPDSARQEAIGRAEQGEAITHSTAREIVSNHKSNGNHIVHNEPEVAATDRFRDDVNDYIDQKIGMPSREEIPVDDPLTPYEQSIAERYEAEDTLDPPMELEQVADMFPTQLTTTDKELLQANGWSEPVAPSPAPESAPISRMNAGMYTSATPEWYTPGHIVDRVKSLFGEIDLDPCSNSSDPNVANVPAKNYWTQADNGLAQPWHGYVYMNPPYGDEIPAWVDRLVKAYESSEIFGGIALLPARPDTAWFQPLFSYHLCWVRGRLKFSGAENSAPFPSVVVYLGDDVQSFVDWFGSLGPIVAPALNAPEARS